MENSPSKLAATTSSSFRTFSQPTTATNPSSVPNPFSHPLQANPIQGATLFGKPTPGISSGFVGSQMSSLSSGGNSVTNVSSATLFGKGPAPTFGMQSSFQSSVANQKSSTFESPVQPFAFPSTKPFGAAATSTSSSSHNLFGNISQAASTSSQATTKTPAVSTPGTNPSSKSSFAMQGTNPFGGGTTSSLLFSGTKPPNVFGTASTLTSSSSNKLFGKNINTNSATAQSAAGLTLGSGIRTSSSSDFGLRSKNPSGVGNRPISSSATFGGTRSEQSEAVSSNAPTSTLFRKSVQRPSSFSGSQNIPSPSKQYPAFSSKPYPPSLPENQKSLFGKPLPLREDVERESSSSSGVKDSSSEVIVPFSSQIKSASQSSLTSQPSQTLNQVATGVKEPKLLFSQSSTSFAGGAVVCQSNQAGQMNPGLPTEQAKTSVSSAQLFGKALQESHPSPDTAAKVESVEEEQEEMNLPGKSLSRWRNSKETLSGFKRKGTRLFTSSQPNKPGTSPAGKSMPIPFSRRLSKDVNSLKSLTVKNIPQDYNDENILRRHFSQFGLVTRFRLTQAKNMLTLTYDSHESATKAKKDGLYIESSSEPLSIFLRLTSQVKPERESPKQSMTSSVDDELQSMREMAEDYVTEQVPVSKASSGSRLSEPHRREQRRSFTPPPTSSQRIKSELRPTERPRSPTPPSSTQLKDSIGSDIKELLKSLRTARALSTSERIAVLDTRDKLLKLLRGRQQANLASAKAFEGTCPDMCPEKERYYREDIRRLALYEVIPSTMSNVAGQKTKVDHSKAVKEYSRSSADQEEPLAIELRPLPVLFNTMVYLLTHVADLGGENMWAEWYDFLWNRTRGIRKEITQQQLCSVEVAELLEKCTRFHIFCSERLCEEDMMSFDQKINNENLTKCLQTLKELYADLEVKQGVFCQNEAEFRGYMALMKLNEGDTLREVQQLRPQIRESSPIKFAIQAHTALNNSNYVRFFRLIEEATFLNGCILHRYFNQIRGQALRIIKKAYRGTNSKFPMQEMIRLLKFENSPQLKEFCSYYAVEVDGNDIILDGRSVLEPESALPDSRSPSLIECKQTVSVGMTIYGGALPPLQLPPPLSSFNQEGAFIFSNEFQLTLVQSGIKLPSQKGSLPSAAQRLPPPTTTVPKNVYSNEAIKSTARTLIVTETDAETISIVKEVIQEEKESISHMALWLREMIHTTLEENIKIIAEDALAEEETMLRQKLEATRQRQRELAMESLTSELLEEVKKEVISEVALKEMSYVRKELHKQCKERCTHACAGDLLEVVIDELMEDVATDVYQVDVVARREMLNQTEKIVQLMRTFRWFKTWRDSQLRRVRVRRAMLDFPAAPKSASQEAQITALVPVRPTNRIKDNTFYIGERARLHIQSPMDVFRQDLHLSAHLSMASTQQMLFNIRMWQPIDLAVTVGNQLLRASQQWNELKNDVLVSLPIQWKLVLSLPKAKYHEEEKEEKFIQWMKARLSLKSGKSPQKNVPSHEGEILSQYAVQLPQKGVNRLKKSNDPNLRFCLRCFHGIWNDTDLPQITKKSLLKGNSGVIFVTQTAEKLVEQEFLWRKEHIRLLQLFTEKSKNPALPLVVIVPRTTSKCTVSVDSIKAFLKLDDLHSSGFLAAVHIAQPLVDTRNVYADVNSEWDTQLTSCLRFLANHIPSPPCLRVKNVSDLVEDAVVEFYKAPVYQDLRTRNRHQMLHQSPNVLIALYNDIIEHVAMAASSNSLMKFSWPAPEFDNQKIDFTSDWNTSSHLADICELITKLRLPYFRYSDREKEDWATLCQDLWGYMNLLTKADSGSAKISLFQQITEMLKSTKKHFDQFCWLASEEGPCEPSYVNMTWTDFIDACVHYKLVSLRTGHLRIELPEPDDDSLHLEEDFKEPLVFYREEEFGDWEAPLSWEDALRHTDSLELGQLKATVQRAASKKEEQAVDLNHADSSADDEECEPEAEQGLKTMAANTSEMHPETNINTGLTDVRTRFEMERKDSERLENFFLSCLKTPRLAGSKDRCDSFISQNDIIFDSKRYGVVSSPLKRRRLSDENDSSPTDSSSLTRRDLPKSQFHKHRRLESSDEEAEETGDKENDLEKKLTKVLKSQTLSERFEKFKRELEEERRADHLLELKMAKWLSSPVL